MRLLIKNNTKERKIVSNKIQMIYESSSVKLSMKERIDYAVSEFGYNSIYIWISAFMAIFCTDFLGVSAASVSLLLLLVRVFDAINDPIIGSMADRSHSKWGRYKPWVAIGGTVMSLLIIALFAAQPGWSLTVKTVYVWIVYILITVASTCCNMPYGALNGVITSDTEERAKLSGVRTCFANIGSNFTNLVAASFIMWFSGTGGTAQTAQGYMWAVIICVILGLPTMIWSAVKSKERVQPPPEQAAKGNKIPFGLQMKCLLGNRYALVSMFGQFAAGFNAYGRMAIMAYYFTYYVGDFSLYSIIGIIGVFAGIIGSGWCGPFTYKLFKHKGKALAFLFSASGVLLLPLFWCSPKGIIFWVLFALSNLFGTAAFGLRYSCDGDNADYAEYKYGVRVDGFLASFISLMLKAGGAVGPAVLVAWLGSLGYVANQAQNAAVLNALNMSMSWIPGALSIICGLAFLIFHNMDGKMHREIVAELEKRRGIGA